MVGSFRWCSFTSLVGGLLRPYIIGQLDLYCMSFEGKELGRGRAIKMHPLGVAGRSQDVYNAGKFVVCVVPQMQLIFGSILFVAYFMKWHGL